jgi:hypothetical protein
MCSTPMLHLLPSIGDRVLAANQAETDVEWHCGRQITIKWK